MNQKWGEPSSFAFDNNLIGLVGFKLVGWKP